MNISAESSKKDTEELERKTLSRLLATPPQPKTSKTKERASPKKRGRPPKGEKAGD